CDANPVNTGPGLPQDVRELRERYRAFMDDHVYPNEPALDREDGEADALVAELRGKAKAEGLWAPHVGPEAGGTGRGFLAYAYLNEVIGRAIWGQLVFGCQAPDAGNAEILQLYGTDEQRERWLRPLVAGEVRSFFSMTEPEVSGVEITPVPVLGHRGHGWTTHCEVRYTGVRVPFENLLGERGDGFRIAQRRLGPGRIHHVMRWLGQMQRAFELLCTRALERE